MKSKVRTSIASMIDGRPDTVVYSDRNLTPSEFERIRESLEEFEDAALAGEALHINLVDVDIDEAIEDLAPYIQQ